MNRYRFKHIALGAAAAAALALTAGACSEVVPTTEQGFVSFSIAIEDNAELSTRAALLGSGSSLSTIYVSGWNNSGSDHAQYIAPYRQLSVSGGVASSDIRWTTPLPKQFYAYANLPATGASVSNATYQSQTLTYTVPQDAANQNDILMAAASATGDSESPTTRNADLNFKHPLTAVEFRVGTIYNLTSITKITIEGVYASGSVTQSANGSFNAWSGTSSTQAVYQTVSDNLQASGAIGVPFVLIPQTAASFAVTIEGSYNSEDVVLYGNIAPQSGNNEWEAGKKNIVTIDYDPRKGLSFTTSLAEWGTASDIDATLEEEVANN